MQPILQVYAWRLLTACWVTYSVAFEQDIQVFCSFTVLVIIEGTLVNGVFTIRLWTITTIEAFLPQSLCNMNTKSKLEELFRMTKNVLLHSCILHSNKSL